MRASIGPLLATLLVTTVLAGCLSGGPSDDQKIGDGSGLVPVVDRHLQPYNVTADWSSTLAEGLHGILDPLSVFIDVDLGAAELGAAADPSVPPQVHMGLWLPDVPEGTLVPVIADVGPYYNDLDVEATEPANRLGRFLIENFVPHGYAVAQVSVFGSGASNHCMDLMGRAEQAGVQAAVEYLGTQEWSNGNVGLIGRSYDGSTPYEAAMIGDEYLKTIVPISGLIGQQELMWRNGSAELRGPIMHNVVYGFFGIDSVENPVFGGGGVNDPDSGDAHTACPDYLTAPAHGATSYALGGEQVDSYWEERHFLPDVLENYKGSVYLIHGLQDWNVDNHMAFPVYQQLEAAGLEVKGLFGQWAHNYPDRLAEHKRCDGYDGNDDREKRCVAPQSVRYDWAQDLLEWFDYYLKGTGPKPALHVEVQDNQGAWRIEESYPPRDLTWSEIPMGSVENIPDMVQIGPTTSVTLSLGTFEEDLRIAGLPQFHATVTPSGPGGQLFLELRDKTADRHLGHAIMDLRYHAGGTDLQTVVPGMPIVAKMEFFAMDIVVPAGNELVLRIANTGEGYLPSSVSTPSEVSLGSDTVLRLPVIDPMARTFFAPPVPVIEE